MSVSSTYCLIRQSLQSDVAPEQSATTHSRLDPSPKTWPQTATNRVPSRVLPAKQSSHQPRVVARCRVLDVASPRPELHLRRWSRTESPSRRDNQRPELVRSALESP